jgi:hypothetical protein
VYVVGRFGRQHHDRAFAVYPTEQFERTPVGLLRVLLSGHGVAIGTIVHASYLQLIFSHCQQFYLQPTKLLNFHHILAQIAGILEICNVFRHISAKSCGEVDK